MSLPPRPTAPPLPAHPVLDRLPSPLRSFTAVPILYGLAAEVPPAAGTLRLAPNAYYRAERSACPAFYKPISRTVRPTAAL